MQNPEAFPELDESKFSASMKCWKMSIDKKKVSQVIIYNKNGIFEQSESCEFLNLPRTLIKWSFLSRYGEKKFLSLFVLPFFLAKACIRLKIFTVDWFEAKELSLSPILWHSTEEHLSLFFSTVERFSAQSLSCV